MSAMKLTAAGDAMIFRRLPGAYAGFEAVRDFIARGDFRFCNLETTVHRYETYAAAVSGGSWFCAPPEVLEDMRAFGFNALSAANNHAMDYSHAGLLKTLSYIREAGFACAGTGATLADAAAPAYVDTLAGRFALIGACSTFHADAMAGEQTRSMPGRPGLNGVRHHTVYRLPEAQLRALRQIADDVMINAAADITRAEGYAPPLPANEAAFGDLRFEAAQEPGQHTCVNETDMLRVEKSIREARFMADYVVVAMHSHELIDIRIEEPAAFYEQFARRCIDAGAHAVIGTGPHLLRPIEIYKGCPIFYSLGDFVLQLETIARAPADMYEKQA